MRVVDEPKQQRWEKVLEIVEVAVLAVVAIATAYSGYQGTQWGGEQARLYGLASTTRFEAEAASTLGGQQLVADSGFFTAWLQAHAAGETRARVDARGALHARVRGRVPGLAGDRSVHEPRRPAAPASCPASRTPR